MKIELRDYQNENIDTIFEAWKRNQNLMYVLPTGGGKTVVVSELINLLLSTNARVAVIVHRKELLCQMSGTLASFGINHNIIGADATIRLACRLNLEKVNASFYDPRANVTVCSVDTLEARKIDIKCDYWILDEGHHLLVQNKWGRALSHLKHAKGLAVTATPSRGDKKGLGRHAEGMIDKMILGPSMLWLIQQGFLSPFKIYSIDSGLKRDEIKRSKANGDFSKPSLMAATKKSTIVGDVVSHYKKYALGKSGITFAPSVVTAEEIADQFNLAGIPAIALSAQNSEGEREATIKKFRAKEILQLVNVDLFDEGFDVPGIEVISLARATMSLAKFLQMIGRGLRTMEGKNHAIILDHVGNVLTHGMPTDLRSWTLDNLGSQEVESINTVSIQECPACAFVYSKYDKKCPECGFAKIPQQRTSAEFVEGDLTELEVPALAELIEKIKAVNAPFVPSAKMKFAPGVAIATASKRHKERQDAQTILKDTIASWAFIQKQKGFNTNSARYKLFFHEFGIDVLSAQLLYKSEAEKLNVKIMCSLSRKTGN